MVPGKWTAKFCLYPGAVHSRNTLLESIVERPRGTFKPGFGLGSLDLLGISARGSFLACPEQLSNAKLSNGPRSRLNLSGDVHTSQTWANEQTRLSSCHGD